VKKAFVILLMVLYSASTIGATINIHYCMNKFAGYSFKKVKKDKCPKCGMKNMGCCKDEKKHIKLAVDQQKTELNTNLLFQVIVLNPVFQTTPNFKAEAIQKLGWSCSHAPPLITYLNTHAFFSTFLI
jgi:hypothetical protein